jgi:hypothetical protein
LQNRSISIFAVNNEIKDSITALKNVYSNDMFSGYWNSVVQEEFLSKDSFAGVKLINSIIYNTEIKLFTKI